MFICLRGETFRVSREHGRLADVVEAEIKHDHTLETDTTTGMGWASVAEGVNVRLYLVHVDVVMLSSLGQQLRIVDTLSARQDLLASNEHVIRVGEFLEINQILKYALK